MESPIWNKRGEWPHYLVLGLDVFTNLGGLYAPFLLLDETASWKALMGGLELAGAGVPQLGAIVSFILALLFSVALAAIPEWAWKQ